MSKPSKAERLANNLLIMMRPQGAGSLYINRRNEEALYAAIDQLGMRPNDFDIQADGCFYLEIRFKRDPEETTRRILSQLKRPVWPEGTKKTEA